MRLNIPAGAVALITPCPGVAEENCRRSANNGSQFAAPWLVLVHGEREVLAPLLAHVNERAVWPYNPAPERVTVELGAFDFNAPGLQAKYTVSKSPHDFIPTDRMVDLGAWLETSEGAEIATEYGETIPRE